MYIKKQQIRPPPFATLALVQNPGGFIRGMRQFLSQLRPPFQ